jgi:hypothetical protein
MAIGKIQRWLFPWYFLCPDSATRHYQHHHIIAEAHRIRFAFVWNNNINQSSSQT